MREEDNRGRKEARKDRKGRNLGDEVDHFMVDLLGLVVRSIANSQLELVGCLALGALHGQCQRRAHAEG